VEREEEGEGREGEVTFLREKRIRGKRGESKEGRGEKGREVEESLQCG